ncbi:MAG: 50S ribosomal protein L1 [Armatimonadetes bacterium]|nr:50S ribosomal protein L1 [Armatimonadota bacterium]
MPSKVLTRRRKPRAHKAHATPRYQEALAQYDPVRQYEPEEAIEAVKKTARAKFDETVEVAVALGVDPRQSDQMVRGTLNLPHGTGKKMKVAVVAKGDKAEEAIAAGADVVGDDDLIAQLRGGWKDFDVLLATPDVMAAVRALGKILGPRMPNPKAGTLTTDLDRVIKEVKGATRLQYRVEKGGIIHAPIGKASYPTDQLMANFLTLVAALLRARPSAAKGRYLKKIVLSSTMGPGIKVDTQKAQPLAEAIRI